MEIFVSIFRLNCWQHPSNLCSKNFHRTLFLIIFFSQHPMSQKFEIYWPFISRSAWVTKTSAESSNKFHHFFSSITRLISCSFKLNVNVNHGWGEWKTVLLCRKRNREKLFLSSIMFGRKILHKQAGNCITKKFLTKFQWKFPGESRGFNDGTPWLRRQCGLEKD